MKNVKTPIIITINTDVNVMEAGSTGFETDITLTSSIFL